MNGRIDQRFHVFLALGAEQAGEPSDPTEAERVEWVPEDRVRRFLHDGSITDGYSLVALCWALEGA